MIGITGAHGTGKSTLAKAVGEDLGITYFPTTATQVYESMQLDPKRDYGFDTRLIVQWRILETFNALYEDHTALPCVTDRTPLDLYAYLLADVQRENLTREQGAAALAYWQACLKSLNRYFSMIVMLQPGIPVEENRAGKAPSNPAYIDHHSRLVQGLMMDEDVMPKKWVIQRSRTGLQDRVEIVADCVAEVLNSGKRQREKAKQQYGVELTQ